MERRDRARRLRDLSAGAVAVVALVGCSPGQAATSDEPASLALPAPSSTEPVDQAPELLSTDTQPAPIGAHNDDEDGVSDHSDAAVVPASDGAICEWLFGATFSNDDATIYFTPTEDYSEIQSEDWVDTASLRCIDNALIGDEDDYDYGLTLKMEDDRLVLETSEFGTLTATTTTTLEEAIAQPDIADPDEQAAMDVGLELIRSVVEDDPDAFARLHADQLIIISDPTIVRSLDSLMESALEDGFPFGQDYGDFTMHDYLARYRPEILTVEDVSQTNPIWAESINEAFPEQRVLVFNGDEPKPEANRFLWDELNTWVLVETDEGWVVAGL